MPFIESAQSAQARAGVSSASKPVVGIVVLLAVAVVGFGVFNTASIGTSGELVVTAGGDAQTKSLPESSGADEAGGAAVSSKLEAAEADTSHEEVVVYVSGAVASPGVYRLGADSRVNDAVDAAGGMLAEALQGSINLARPLQDGEQIAVPFVGEEMPVQEQVAIADAAPEGYSGLVNINTADAAELESLPGVGPATAEKIIASREAEGPFASVEDIKRVSGIGDKKFEAIADLVTV